jgi:GNAT superfamily N-acetyltransferase
VLRPAEPQDATAIAEIWWRGWQDGHLGHVPDELVLVRTEESFRQRATERVGEITVAVVDGEVAGFVLVADDEVEQVYVSAAHRGTGVSRLLLEEGERQVRENGHSTAWLAVVAGNARARAFYAKAGWRDEGSFMYEAASEDGPIAVPCHRYAKDI